ncbi:phosphoribosyl-ATP diphosphatase [Candidatus Pandoraea novymonadis]|uniref:Phosphoribosyl-ATP pyrophosphatase n=1 Tax=Candidatus Pandoraea novymonadis TaxID=1808959 RepID=A0ABX5FCU8_9BURK|nr:phosphoribosyl-ATP diphosphatase [Candidatus Pandoraea novymonadis]PSB91585.1 Phosphoribosyl-ATP pyrophosphatase [Candidatus Pandoraea novymonadis]
MNKTLKRVTEVIKSRKGGDKNESYVASLFHKGDDAILKKIAEEATEIILAAKDIRIGASSLSGDLKQKLVNETTDFWFHSMVLLVHHGLSPDAVLTELERREGLSGLTEKAQRKSSDG